MLSQTRLTPAVSHILEKQMRQWELNRTQQERQSAPLFPPERSKIKFVAISRELGSDGEKVAECLSRFLGWPVYDKQVLEHMASDLNIHSKLVESMDEKSINWIEEWLSPVFTDHIGQYRYYHHLSKVLMILANHGDAIILGRAAGLLLPREQGMSVRVVTPMEQRCKTIARQSHISTKQALHKAEKSDKIKRQFVKHFLKKNFDDYRHFDLVINTDQLNSLAAARLIWRTLDLRQNAAKSVTHR